MTETLCCELCTVLAAHAGRYPAMQVQDAVKLLYQSEFGGGHLIVNAQQSLNRLQAELETVQYDPSLPLYEEIGCGFVRVQLAALDTTRYSAQALNRDFVRSAAEVQGDSERFMQKLELLREQAPNLGFHFSQADVEAYLASYLADGCPMVSHSAAYRAAYHPAYRVLKLR